MRPFTPHSNFEAIGLPNVSPVPLVVLTARHVDIPSEVEMLLTVDGAGWTHLERVQFGGRRFPGPESLEGPVAPPGYTFQARIEGGRVAVYRVALKEVV